MAGKWLLQPCCLHRFLRRPHIRAFAVLRSTAGPASGFVNERALDTCHRASSSSCCRGQTLQLARRVQCSAAVEERPPQYDTQTSNYSSHLQWPGRSRMCGTLTEQDIDSDVTICGWVHRYRNFGGVVFADIRDQSGILQVFDSRWRVFDARLARLKSCSI